MSTTPTPESNAVASAMHWLWNWLRRVSLVLLTVLVAAVTGVSAGGTLFLFQIANQNQDNAKAALKIARDDSFAQRKAANEALKTAKDMNFHFRVEMRKSFDEIRKQQALTNRRLEAVEKAVGRFDP